MSKFGEREREEKETTSRVRIRVLLCIHDCLFLTSHLSNFPFSFIFLVRDISNGDMLLEFISKSSCL